MVRLRAWTVDDLETWLEEAGTSRLSHGLPDFGNPFDAEEAVQEAFLRAWRFRASMPTGSEVRPWLYRVVVNACNSKLRQEIPFRDHRSAVADLSAVPSVATPGQVAGSQDLIRAIADLPTHLRIVVVLRYYADLGEREIRDSDRP